MPQKPIDDWEPVINDWEPVQKKGFVQGLLDFPEEMYDQVNTAGKTALGQIKEGDYLNAFHTIAAPVWNPVEELIKGTANKLEGKPFMDLSGGKAGEIAKSQALGIAGLPTERFNEAWAAKDYPRLGGQAVGAAGTLFLGHKAGQMFGGRPEDLGPLPTVEEIKPKGLPPVPSEHIPYQPTIDVKALESAPVGEPRPAGPEPTPGSVEPNGPEPVGPHEPIVRKNWNQAQIEYWKKRGYVAGGVDPETGYARMIYQGGTQPPPPPASSPQTPQQPMEDGSIPFHENDGFTVPGHQLNKSVIDGLKQQGYELIDTTPDGGGVFKRVAESRDMPAEMARPIMPGEPTGRVAQFGPAKKFKSETEQLIDEAHKLGINPDDYSSMGELAHDVQVRNGEYGSLPEDASQSPYGPEYAGQEEFPDLTPEEFEKAPIVSFPNPPKGQILDFRQQNQLDRIGQAPQEEQMDLGPQPSIQDFEGPSEMRRGPTREQIQATDEGYAVLPPGYKGPFDNHVVIRTLPDGSRVIDPARTVGGTLYPDRPASMEVPGTRRGGGLSNIAVGPEMKPSTRLLDLLGSSLYGKDRPSVVAKELFQNSADERKISGNQDPIRIAFRRYSTNPATGEESPSIIVQDRGRGMSAEELYTIFTDVGTTGKGNVVDASGGFGMAKAAPLLGADYVKVLSTHRDPDTGELVHYSFEGSPKDLKNQEKGVPLKDELEEDPSAKTGLRVQVFFPKGTYLDSARSVLKKLVEGTPGMKDVDILDDRNFNDRHVEEFLEHGTHSGYGDVSKPQGLVIPPYKDVILTPGADAEVHYSLDNKERRFGELIFLNNGLHAFTTSVTYAPSAVPHVPEKIVINVKATVEEGTPGYPFTINREQMDDQFVSTVKEWIKNNISDPAEDKRIDELQRVFDELQPAPGNPHVIMDSGDRYTPEELSRLQNSPHLNKVAGIMGRMLIQLDQLVPTGVPFGQLGRTVKYGFQVNDPDRGGINIPSPRAPNNAREFAILVNVLGHMTEASDPEIAAERIAHAILHEFNHNRERSEGGGFTWKLLLTDTAFGTRNRANVVEEIYDAITGPDGDYAPGVRQLLQDYTESRGRPATTVDTLSRQREIEYLEKPQGSEGIPDGDQPYREDASEMSAPPSGGGGNVPPTPPMGGPTGGTPPNVPPIIPKKKPGVLRELYNLTRGLTTTLDLSASMRQGLPLIGTKAFWTSWKQQIQALGSEGAFNKTLADLKARPLFQSRFDPRTGRVIKSWAEQAGMRLSDLDSNLTGREESTASNWAETGGMFGSDNIVQKGYKQTIGRGVRATNRAYTAYLNQLRADTFEGLLKDAKRIFDAGKTEGVRDPYKDLPFAKEIADFVNTATGRGPLRTARPTIEGGKVKLMESNFEQHAKALTDILFSPRLMASRVRMLNPATYMMASPFVRKQYIKALLGVAGAWGTFAALGKMAGADVSTDPNSADFGKIKIGNTRIDPAGGFQQYIVAASRLLTGHTTSSNTQQDFELGQGYRPDTRKDIAERFMANKLHPVVKFGYDLLNASEHQPFSVGDRTAQLFVPLIVGDTLELMKEDPTLLPLMIPVTAGMGTQTYGKGESQTNDRGVTENKFIPKDYDWNVTGGELPNLWDDRQ